jgi:hypothetical protein
VYDSGPLPYWDRGIESCADKKLTYAGVWVIGGTVTLITLTLDKKVGGQLDVPADFTPGEIVDLLD